jgi:PPP family 3-phenylpropionic acid transporter
MSAMRAPIVPTSTALALDHLEKENRPNDFGTLRLWGSIGFILTSFIIGGLVIGTSLEYIIILYSLNLFILTAISLTLPDAPLSRGANWREGLILLKREPVLVTFLFGVLFVGMTVGIVNQYLAVYLDDIQASGLIIGIAMAISALPEVPLMALVPKMILRWGVTTVFMAGIAVLPVRWFLYTIIDDPLLVIPTQLLHGISMTAILVVGVIYVDRLLARQWRTTGQAIYAATQFGIGPSIGLFTAGYLYEYGGIKPIWVFCTIVGLTGLAIVAWSARLPNLNRVKERSQP